MITDVRLDQLVEQQIKISIASKNTLSGQAVLKKIHENMYGLRGMEVCLFAFIFNQVKIKRILFQYVPAFVKEWKNYIYYYELSKDWSHLFYFWFSGEAVDWNLCSIHSRRVMAHSLGC